MSQIAVSDLRFQFAGSSRPGEANQHSIALCELILIGIGSRLVWIIPNQNLIHADMHVCLAILINRLPSTLFMHEELYMASSCTMHMHAITRLQAN